MWVVHWKLGEVVYGKLKAVNNETCNKNNRAIAGRAKSPKQSITEPKNAPNNWLGL